MRVFSVILSFIILTVVVFPLKTIQPTEKSKHSCCKTQDTDHNSSKTTDDCCNNGCNPFLNCCGMMGFVPVEKNFEQAFVLIAISESFEFYIPMISSYGNDIWQPPKIQEV